MRCTKDMDNEKIKSKKTIRKGSKNVKNKELFLYGRLRDLSKAVAYCNLHRCYLEPKDIKEKRCNKKKCKYKKELVIYNGS